MFPVISICPSPAEGEESLITILFPILLSDIELAEEEIAPKKEVAVADLVIA